MLRAGTRPISALAAAALGLASFGLAACTSGDEAVAPTSVRVAATLFPLEEIVRNVAGTALGETVELVQVVPPGQAVHDVEPTPQQLEALGSADVVLYVGGGFQPSIEEAVATLPDDVTIVDLLDAVEVLPVTDPVAGDGSGDADADHGTGGGDPHAWLSPDRMTSMAAAAASVIEQRLEQAGLDGAAAVAAGVDRFATAMHDLDVEYSNGLALCESSTLVTGHHAFAYLAASFGLTYASIAGISPSEEPSAATLESIADYATANGVTTIFFEENLPDDLARTLADEIGAQVGVLDPIESPSRDQLDAGATYVSLMQDNLRALRTGLRCT
ncbi:MAG: metal ABC transporter substrate-binding protein [Ilumatobacteraceae bacterium]